MSSYDLYYTHIIFNRVYKMCLENSFYQKKYGERSHWFMLDIHKKKKFRDTPVVNFLKFKIKFDKTQMPTNIRIMTGIYS